MILHVQYKNNSYGYVDGPTLDTLLLGKTVQRFYRPSEERWINVYQDSIRGIGGEYSGSDRRQGHKTT
jgi:hypothetical protein